jgi:hypothetical protein
MVGPLLLVLLLWQAPGAPPPLPPAAGAALAQSLEDARRHQRHLWRDTAAMNADGTVTVFVEIARGDRRKWEFNIARNRREVTRVIPEDVGGYPVNYGFVPQTMSYDGDPFDGLVLGPALPGGTLVRGAIVGILHHEDEKGLTRYKRHEGKVSRVLGWGPADVGLAFVRATHTFFRRARAQGGER